MGYDGQTREAVLNWVMVVIPVLAFISGWRACKVKYGLVLDEKLDAVVTRIYDQGRDEN